MSQGMTAVSEFLAQVCAEARARVAVARRGEPLDTLRERARSTATPPAFGSALRGGRIVAEVKRASPSRGVIVDTCDAAGQATAYVAGGAAAVSVLTEPAHFHGHLRDLGAAASAVDVPVLRKDFTVDPYQVYEARAAGAAAVLLLVAALDQFQLERLLRTARDAGIEALIETHDVAEAERATAALEAVPPAVAPVVGINARDLRRLSVDRGVFAAVVGALPDHAVVVAESGVNGPADVERYVRDGADAVLVGEHLMRAKNPAAATRALSAAAANATALRPEAIAEVPRRPEMKDTA
jgi:indole-3-glycerol phosphate synthase